MFTITRHSNPVGKLPFKPKTVTECRNYFIREWSNYRIELFDETGDGIEIFIVIGNNREHIRFHAKREK